MKTSFFNVLKQKLNVITGTIVISGSFLGFSQNTSFPFETIPNSGNSSNSFTTTINVNTTASSFNTLLLGGNLDFNSGGAGVASQDTNPQTGSGRGSQGFNALGAQSYFNQNTQTVIRFPQGVNAHHYNWESTTGDGITVPADSRYYFTENFLTVTRSNGTTNIITNHRDQNLNVRLGYPSLRDIINNSEESIDLLTVLNVVNNDEDSNRRRYASLINDGLNANDFELGNEYFFQDQRSAQINTNTQFTDRAKLIVTEIREEAASQNRSVRFGLPISHRPSPLSEARLSSDPSQARASQVDEHPEYNRNMVDSLGLDNFNAIVVHRYVRENRMLSDTNNSSRFNDPTQLDTKNLARLFRAGRIIEESIEYCSSFAPDKAIWLTEWGVAGTNQDRVGAAILGAANAYLHLIRNSDDLNLERMNWFTSLGANATNTVSGTRQNPVFTKTGFGETQQRLKDAVLGNSIYKNITVTTPDLVFTPSSNTNDPNFERPEENRAFSTKAVNAIAVDTGDNSITYVIVNLGNKDSRIALNINGSRRTDFSVVQSGFRLNPNLRLIDRFETFDDVTPNDEDSIVISPFTFMVAKVTFDTNTAKSSSSKTSTALENQDQAIQISPNPAINSFNIKTKGFNNAHVVVSDILGKTVLQTATTNGNVTLSKGNTFKTGVYLIKVTDDATGKFFNSKLVIQ